MVGLNNGGSLYPDEWSDQVTAPIEVTIWLNDFSVQSWEVGLVFELRQSNTILFKSKIDYKNSIPFVVSPGVPLVLKGSDFLELFNYDALEFVGISRTTLEANQRLPEGSYTFCFKVVDYATQRDLSKPFCLNTNLSLLNPPTIVWPVCGGLVEANTWQNIMFQWQHSGWPSAVGMKALSELSIYEVVGQWNDPSTALFNQQTLPVWHSDPLIPTSVVYDTRYPLLESGKRYVATVKMSDGSGRVRFRNNGLSAPCWFQYGYYEHDTLDILAPLDSAQFGLRDSPMFTWHKPKHALSFQQVTYVLTIVELQPHQQAHTALNQNQPFYTQAYLPTNQGIINKTIPISIWANIKPMQNYAWRIEAFTGTQKVAESLPHVFIGPPPLEAIVAGGFYCPIKRVSYFNANTGALSAAGILTLQAQQTIHTFTWSARNLTVSALGDYTWLLTHGEIKNAIGQQTFTFSTLDEYPGSVVFTADTLKLNAEGLRFTGPLVADFPLKTNNLVIPKILFRRTELGFSATQSFFKGDRSIGLSNQYTYGLKHLNGFKVELDSSTTCTVYQNTVSFKLNGYIYLPTTVLNGAGSRAKILFNDKKQLNYFSDSLKHEVIALGAGHGIVLAPLTYTFDCSDKVSPNPQITTAWKGVYMGRSQIALPPWPDKSNQLHAAKGFSFSAWQVDSGKMEAFVTDKGLTAKVKVGSSKCKEITFNGFKNERLNYEVSIINGVLESSCLSGEILIPFIDELKTFPWRCEIEEEGLRAGYLMHGLRGVTFTVNTLGSVEEKVHLRIDKAMFSGRDAVELSVIATWPWLKVNEVTLSGLKIWGNGDIGFGVANGTVPLNPEIETKFLGYQYLLTQVGCGRTNAVYGFGVSGEAVIDEEMTGELGPPQLNLYSVYSATAIASASQGQTSHTTTTAGSFSDEEVQQKMGMLFSVPGISARDTGGLYLGQTIRTASVQMVTHSWLQTLKQLSDFVMAVKPFIKADALTAQEWRIIEAITSALNSETALQLRAIDSRYLLNFLLNKIVESTANRVTQPIQKVSNLAITKIRKSAKVYIYDPVTKYTDKVLDACFNRITQELMAACDPSLTPLIKAVVKEVKSEITSTLTGAIQSSFEKHAIAPICDFLTHAVTARAVHDIRSIVIESCNQFVSNGLKGKFSLGQLGQDAFGVLQHVSDTVVHALLRMHGKFLLNKGEALANDILKNLNWQEIGEALAKKLVKKGVHQFLTNQLASLVPESARPFINSALQMVKFDFTNLDTKIKQGDLKEVVVVDPTNFYLESPAIDMKGQLKLYRNDAVYGDCFKALVMARVKVPNKEQPISCEGQFLIGKFGSIENRFSFWYASLNVSGLNVSVTPVPVIWDGVEGYFFKHMRLNNNSVTPDLNNKFGVGCKFFFYDMPTSGKTWLMEAGLNLTFDKPGFSTELTVDASILNFRKSANKYIAPGLISGKGLIGFYTDNANKHFAGSIQAKLNTEPLLCLGGQVGFDLYTPQKWSFWLGTSSSPIGYKVLCKENLAHTGYMVVKQDGITLQLKKQIKFSAESKWINVSGARIKGAVGFNSGYEVNTSVQWEPEFKINEASFLFNSSGNLTLWIESNGMQTPHHLAGANFTGLLSLQSHPQMELHGKVSASVNVLQYAFTLNTDVHYNLATQQIIIK